MDWQKLANYQCPKDAAHLRLIRLRGVFVCSNNRCDFVIRKAKREDIAHKYPQVIPEGIVRFLEEALMI